MNQIDDLMEEIRQRVDKNERVLVTTLTKRMAEELDNHLRKWGVSSAYIHSDVDTLERIRILEDLRDGVYDVLVGVNLLREGLDLPQVSLVVILDADKEGFLRNHRSLTQTAGRAARNVNGKVIMYADKITDSMQRTIDETERRRAKQMLYNEKHGITPSPIIKKSSARELITLYGGDAPEVEPITNVGQIRNTGKLANPHTPPTSPVEKRAAKIKKATVNIPKAYYEEEQEVGMAADPVIEYMSIEEIKHRIAKVNEEMLKAAKKTDFISATKFRNELIELQDILELKEGS